tara:strand:- start:2291 stop:2785 length:495 start_codon:yes stop_codon:yes gene_type:complete
MDKFTFKNLTEEQQSDNFTQLLLNYNDPATRTLSTLGSVSATKIFINQALNGMPRTSVAALGKSIKDDLDVRRNSAGRPDNKRKLDESAIMLLRDLSVWLNGTLVKDEYLDADGEADEVLPVVETPKVETPKAKRHTVASLAADQAKMMEMMMGFMAKVDQHLS